MNEIASRGQLRLSYLRWALVTVPSIVFLGFLSALAANSGYGNRWFVALRKPGFMPPASAFPVAWAVAYVLTGLAIAMILHARGARLRGIAIGLFLLQLIANYLWSPLFFALHQVTVALALLALTFLLALGATIVFFRIRTAAGWLMLPYLAWLLFASALNFGIMRLNPGAETLVVPALRTQI
jgi:benzodiazapine receptor